MSKNKSQFIGEIQSIGYDTRTLDDDKIEIFAIFEMRLDRVRTLKSAEKKIILLKKRLLGKEVVLFAP